MVKRKAGWTPTMEQRADLEGRQVKCLIASEGHLWMRNYFDRLVVMEYFAAGHNHSMLVVPSA